MYYPVSFSDFSLSKYLEEIGTNLQDYGSTLPSTIANRLLEKLGVLQYLTGQNCSTGSSSTPNYLNNGRSLKQVKLKLLAVLCTNMC